MRETEEEWQKRDRSIECADEGRREREQEQNSE